MLHTKHFTTHAIRARRRVVPRRNRTALVTTTPLLATDTAPGHKPGSPAACPWLRHCILFPFRLAFVTSSCLCFPLFSFDSLYLSLFPLTCGHRMLNTLMYQLTRESKDVPRPTFPGDLLRVARNIFNFPPLFNECLGIVGIDGANTTYMLL